jgi:hypothetical protein
MAIHNPTKFTLSLNTIVISGFAILIAGALSGYYLPRLNGLRSKADFGGGGHCASEASDVANYREHLIGILRGGGKLSPLQMNTFIDLVDIRDGCLSDLESQNRLAD